jgi:glycosyltransferase involved in cell wall biosynthesis
VYTGPDELLVFGKLQRVKGTENVAAAVARLFEARPDLDFVVRFVGLDMPCEVHHQRMSQCVMDAIPSQYRERVSIATAIPRAQLASYLASIRGLRAAIIASEFETFNMAAHELAYLRVPLIISNIPAFREFFTPRNAFVFAAGNVTSLTGAIADALSDTVKARRLRSQARIQYGDVVEPYLLSRPADTELALLCRPMHLLEATIARLVRDTDGLAALEPTLQVYR